MTVTDTPAAADLATASRSEGLTSQYAVAAVAFTAGAVATFSGASPTSTPAADLLIVGVGVGLVTFLGARYRRLSISLALVAGLLSFTWIGAAVGVVAATAAYVVPPTWRSIRVVNAVLIGLAMNLAARSELDGFLGLSALVAVAIAAVVIAVGFGDLSLSVRRFVIAVAAALGVIAVVSIGAFGIGSLTAADDLRRAGDLTDDGLEALRRGDLDDAQVSLDQAADAFDSAASRIGAPWSAAVEFLPGLAQHRQVATSLGSAASDAAELIAAELDCVDLAALSVQDGRVDVDAVRALSTPLEAIDGSLTDLQMAIADVDSHWLLPAVGHRLDRLADRVAQQRERSARALETARVAPALLGADEPRTYFVGFTTPSEARGLGGFMGNWAEVTVDDGHIEMTRFGRSDDLDDGGDPATRRLPEDPEFTEWLARYGAYNLNSGPDGTTGTTPWKNLNMSPDMSMTGRAVAELYPQSGGGGLDGVFTLDVYTLAKLVAFAGPIPLPDGMTMGGATEISTDNAVRFLLNKQYDLTEKAQRIDVLEDFSRLVLDELLTGTLPAADELVDELGPMVEEGRLAAWMSRPAEQLVIERVGWAGTFPSSTESDAVAVAFNNAAGNKIDYFLRSEAHYDVTADARSGTAQATLTLEMRNEAPESGQPGYVIGNLIGKADGSNRTWVSVFTRLPVTAVLRDGEPVTTEPGFESGLFVTSMFVSLESGASTGLTLEMAGPADVADGYDVAIRTPPVVGSQPFTLNATWIDSGGASHEQSETLARAGLHHVSTS